MAQQVKDKVMNVFKEVEATLGMYGSRRLRQTPLLIEQVIIPTYQRTRVSTRLLAQAKTPIKGTVSERCRGRPAMAAESKSDTGTSAVRNKIEAGQGSERAEESVKAGSTTSSDTVSAATTGGIPK